ncbi:MAG: quinone oxidoreductase [Vicinamibacterales bacterium]
MKTKAIRVHQTGGPEVLRFEEVELPPPGAGDVLIRQTAIGLNYIDTYHRSGLYPLPLPTGLGSEGAGIVEQVGPNVTDLAVDDRVAYASGPLGAYAERRIVPADRLVRLPPAISDDQAASMMLKGMTAQYLLRRTYRVKAGDTILVHAAAGGVGLIVCQWARHLGATVIGTAGSDEKLATARAHGCNHVINYRTEKFSEAVKRITNGKGVQVVYDGVGKDTFIESLDCLMPLGMMVSFGNASGPVAPVNIMLLAQKGSLFLTRPTLFTHILKREDLVASAEDLFGTVASGDVTIKVNQRYPLAEAARAHADLEARKTTGSTVLVP